MLGAENMRASGWVEMLVLVFPISFLLNVPFPPRTPAPTPYPSPPQWVEFFGALRLEEPPPSPRTLWELEERRRAREVEMAAVRAASAGRGVLAWAPPPLCPYEEW